MRRRVIITCLSFITFIPLVTVLLSSQDATSKLFERREDGSVRLFDGRVVPPLPRLLGVRAQYELRLEWLVSKHAQLLPMMRQHGVAMWIVTSHEFHPDAVFEHIAPDLYYTGRFDVHVFVDSGDEGLARFSNYWRPTENYQRFFEPLPVPRSDRGRQDVAEGLRALYQRYDPETIALNMGGVRGQNSGITLDAHRFLSEALEAKASGRFVSASVLIEDYLDTRLPGELEPYRALVLATDVIAQRALSNEVITPGVTRAADVKWWFNQQIASLGVDAEPWFEIHTAVQRWDPSTGNTIPYVHPAPQDLVYQKGDVIHLDCGFNYLGFASDWQKVAYILREGEDDAPEGLTRALENANIVHQAMASAPRPGMTGREATLAIIKELEGVDFQPSIYSHAIGHHGHAVGPSLSARDMELGVRPEEDSVLRPGAYRSIEFSARTAVPEWNGETVLIPMEDDAYLTEKGYVYFRPYQTEWYLIR